MFESFILHQPITLPTLYAHITITKIHFLEKLNFFIILFVDAQFCPGYCVYFHFGATTVYFHFGPRARLWGVSNLGLEPCSFPFIYLFYLVFESLCVSYLFRVKCRFMSICYLYSNIVSSNVMSCRFVSYFFLRLFFIIVFLINRVL